MTQSPQTIFSLDLFCGIGGLTLGLERSGISSLGGVDIWEDAGKTFRHNLPNTSFLCADVTKTTPEEILRGLNIHRDDLDVVVGGPPCQGFSTVGKRLVDDPRNSLWAHYLQTVSHIRPAYVVIENVEGLNIMKGGKVRDGIIKAFNEIGYQMKSQILVAADFGVPQLRKRIVFLGWLPELQEPHFPKPTHSKKNWVTVAEAIFDLPPLSSGACETNYTMPPTSNYQKIMRGGATALDNHEAAKHPLSLVEVLSHIPDGGNRKSIPDHLQPTSGFHNSYARLSSKKPAIAVTANMRKPSSARSTHPIQNRGLTVREGLRLQTFPDDFRVLGTRTSQYQQVGNAVPPLLGEAIGRSVAEAFFKNTIQTVKNARNATPQVIESMRALKSQSDLFEMNLSDEGE